MMSRMTQADADHRRSDRGERERLDRMLDIGLALTFPGSDPVAITISRNEPAEYSDTGDAGTRPAALPDGLEPYRRTAIFTQDSVPTGLRRAHRTAAGIWALIQVVEGRLLYRINEPTATELVLEPDRVGVIEPTISHEVAPLGAVRFYIEFHRLRGRS
ncbi:Uncharacterized protein, possibly involved in tellurite resistance [Rhizobiales bacterium GAS113]|nr:Uncharacterized protein, possibly involved in tellurite resistance [Rhizobiales bacterium GAS113]